MSSAYIKASADCKHLLKSLTFIKNKIEPRIEPCGTPQKISAGDDRHFPYAVHCLR